MQLKAPYQAGWTVGPSSLSVLDFTCCFLRSFITINVPFIRQGEKDFVIHQWGLSGLGSSGLVSQVPWAKRWMPTIKLRAKEALPSNDLDV